MYIKFCGCGISDCGDFTPFCLTLEMAKFSLQTMDYYNPWSSKNLIDRNRLKKFMQVWIDIKCIHTNFGGRGLSSFGDIITLKNGQISLSDHGL